MKGITRKFLRINLSTGKIGEEAIPEPVETDFIGGRGFGIHYLYREVAPESDPLGEHNKMIFVAGPLAGTSAQSVSRWMVCTRSPLTGALARSVAGADFGAWIKFAGYEFILVEGKAERPVYIHLTRDACRIQPADELWGKDTVVTQEWLSQRHGLNTRVACIGPGGENLVKYAAIVTNRRTASRCGVGAVMGSKNLKAIAINAERNLQLHDPEGFKQLVKQQIQMMMANKAFQYRREMGTTGNTENTSELGIFPTKKFPLRQAG